MKSSFANGAGQTGFADLIAQLLERDLGGIELRLLRLERLLLLLVFGLVLLAVTQLRARVPVIGRSFQAVLAVHDVDLVLEGSDSPLGVIHFLPVLVRLVLGSLFGADILAILVFRRGGRTGRVR